MSSDEVRIDPDDDTFIRNGVINHWSMDSVVFNKQYIPRLQVVGLALHDIGYLAG